MAQTTEPIKLTHNEYTVGWVCALPKEQTAATAMLDLKHADLPKPSNDSNTYTLGSIGKHNIVIACLPKGDIGTNPAATVAIQMVRTFPSIKIGLMVGIGGGIPSSKVRLGDVVVSAPVGEFGGVVQWDLGKAQEGGKFKRTGALNKPPTSLRTALSKLETEHEINGSKIPEYLEELKQKHPRLVSKYLRSDSLTDVLFRSECIHVDVELDAEEDEDEDEAGGSCRSCDRDQIVKRKPRDMCIHYGLIASGNQVIKDAILRNKLKADLGENVLCVEMEAAGLMNNFPCIVIRGICDYADSHKNKNWQEHAAAVAAAFAKELLGYVQPDDVNGEKSAKDILGHNKTEDSKILDWLTPINYGSQQNDIINRRAPETGKWLLDSIEFLEWINSDGKTLFCPGIPGAGKTTMTSIVVAELNTRYNDENIGIAYIYFNFREDGSQKLDSLLASLLKQLAQTRSTLPDPIKNLHNRRNTKNERPSLNDIKVCLQNIVMLYSRVFILVDALDECKASENCRSAFISEIFGLQDKSKINLFATSRFIPEITDLFDESITLEVRASDEDIRRYLRGHIGILPSFVKHNPKLPNEIETAEVETSIIKAVDGMFLLAKLHLDSLKGAKSKKVLRTALSQLATGIDAYGVAYDDAMKRIKYQGPREEELAKEALSWIVHATRPLSVSELQTAIAIEVGKAELDKENITPIQDIISVCAGLVIIDEKSEIIRLVHYTTQEYFQKNHAQWFPDAVIDITKSCVTYLSLDVFGSGPCSVSDELNERLKSNPLYDYASRNWGHHARTASVLIAEVISFLERNTHVEASSEPIILRFYGFYYQPNSIMTGLHLVLYFEIYEVMEVLVSSNRPYKKNPDPKDWQGKTPLMIAVDEKHEAIVKLLLENGASVDAKDSRCQTSLIVAVRNRHEAMVRLLLENRASIDAKDINGQTPLILAVNNEHKAIVRLLLENGASIDAKDVNGQTPLMLAVNNKYKAIVRLLLENGASIDAKDVNGQTPLMLAVNNKYKAIVRLLLENGASIDAKDVNGQTPLMLAVNNKHEAIVRLLLENGASIDAKDVNGQTPLMLAVNNEHKAIVRLLLENGASIDAKDVNGQTPLMLAVNNKHEAIVRLLLENGASTDAKDFECQTPLILAVNNRHEAIVRLLLENGASTDAKDFECQTPLILAVKNRHEAMVRLPLETVANTEQQDLFRRTPLAQAIAAVEEQIVKILLEKGANIEAKDISNRTPLSWAAWGGKEEVVKMLLEKGANVEAKDTSNRTPLSWAAWGGKEEVVKMLLEKGANVEAKDTSNRTPLSWAAERRENICKIVLGAKAKGDNDSNSIISLKADGEEFKRILYLLKSVADEKKLKRTVNLKREADIETEDDLANRVTKRLKGAIELS
ncbi:hypothetical protein ACMFMF_010485 [Clarireedia jacksonii]